MAQITVGHTVVFCRGVTKQMPSNNFNRLARLAQNLKKQSVLGKVGLYGALIGKIFRCDHGSNPRVLIEVPGHNREILNNRYKTVVEVRGRGRRLPTSKLRSLSWNATEPAAPAGSSFNGDSISS